MFDTIVREWENEPDYLEFWYEGYRCEIFRNIFKSLNGYVNFDAQNHPNVCAYIAGKTTYDLDIDVHGGVTFLEEYKIGFDCLHLGDFQPLRIKNRDDLIQLISQLESGIEKDPSDKNYEQSLNAAKKLLALQEDMYMEKALGYPAIYRNIEYVRGQIEHLVDQLIEIEKGTACQE